ncbi:rhomboid protease ROM6, putative [Plasmodium ovale]|uniref:Rhomboid protease ROM6, putative n=1 Tax=Plasmodium ovale TaxID=36330 RepID=A0A1C3KUW9_PLAOA|nr:rhomboid protease ROM6, putative [Plasmodium ovale]
MFRSYRYLRDSHHYKRNFLYISKKRQFHDFAKKKGARTANAVKRRDKIKEEKNVKLREKIKLIIFSSIYLFACDYLYHVYILKDSRKRVGSLEGEKKGPNCVNEGVSNGTLLSYFKVMNIFPNEKGQEKEGQRDYTGEHTNYHKGETTRNQKEDIKKFNALNEDPYEIKINRIKSKDETGRNCTTTGNSTTKGNRATTGNGSEGKNLSTKNQVFSYDQGGSPNGQEKNFKDLIADNFYRNDILNGCNLFLFANGLVFLGWRINDIARNQKFFHFMCRNFICSYENIKRKYFHTIITASISHMTLPHFLFNMWAFHTITNTLLCPEIKENKKNRYLFFNYKSNVLEKKINDRDIINICILSSLLSTLPYIFLHKKNQLLGASGSIMGLIFILSTVKPNEVFISLFPFPYLKMTALQLCHISILTNFLFLLFKKNHFNIAWSAHLFGLLGGAIYNLYQRKKKKNYNYYPFIQLSIKNGYIDYLNSYFDFVDMLKCFNLQLRLLFSLDHRVMQNINKKIHTIKFLQSQRRSKFHAIKLKNLEAISRS